MSVSKILSAAQIRTWDAHTMEHHQITSIDLMEQAAVAFAEWFASEYSSKNRKIYVICGVGNNGGDGFAVARLLSGWKYDIRVIHCLISLQLSKDCALNKERLVNIPSLDLNVGDNFPSIQTGSIIIDAIFGSGLNRVVEGYWANLLNYLNRQDSTRIAIDIPSGLFADQHTKGIIFKADHTATFQIPKLAFFLAENQDYVGECRVLNIGLSNNFLARSSTSFYTINASVKGLIRPRRRHDHKGTFGHALIIAGSYGKIGAAFIASKAVLRSGAGLVTTHLPKCGYEILQISLPEAMTQVDSNSYVFSKVPNLTAYKAIGIGPGLGTDSLTVRAVTTVLKEATNPLVIDADALNIIAAHPDLFEYIPTHSILTPHPKEFERLFGKTTNDFERIELLRSKAQQLNCYILLKGGYTAIANPEGDCYFNTNGNAGMGTAGMGDALTGILTGLLAQGYAPLHSCLLGVYLHGEAGDKAAKKIGQSALMASDLLEALRVESELTFPKQH